MHLLLKKEPSALFAMGKFNSFRYIGLNIAIQEIQVAELEVGR